MWDGSKKRWRECGTTGWGRWSSLSTCLVSKPQLTREKNSRGNNQLVTTVTAESTSLSHDSRGHISWNCAQGMPFTCIQGEWCLQDNCRAAAAVSLILASFHKILRILGGRSFSIPKLNLVSRDHRR